MFQYPIELEIDGIKVRSPLVGGMNRKPEPIWSKNAGRARSQKMRGTIRAIKQTYSIKWPPLSQQEQDLIESLVCNKDKPFHMLKVRRPDGSIWEMECYFGPPSFKEWVWIDGQWMDDCATVDAIER